MEYFTWGFAAEAHEYDVAVNCLRINFLLATEGWKLVFLQGKIPETAGAEKPEVAAEAALSLLGQPPSFTGANIEITQMRMRYGIPKRQPWTEDSSG